jgi:3-deoxy-manno-octulosonate cytidylyltransferase (CMP-KDO synthetase)
VKIAGIIPARFASHRFPGKPLADIFGKPMIQRVYEQSVQCPELSEVVVATDDERIMEAVLRFGGQCMMTSPEHPSGTDRCAEVAERLEEVDAIINIQGDEPVINPQQISEVAALLNRGAAIATLARHSQSQTDYFNNNIVKVALDEQGKALQFSRSTVINAAPDSFYVHIGIYGFTNEVLQEITRLPQGKLEMQEKLEQLRWLENDYTIHVGITNFHSISIDSPEDLKKLSGFFG